MRPWGAEAENFLSPPAEKIAFHPAFTQGGQNMVNRFGIIAHGGNLRPARM